MRPPRFLDSMAGRIFAILLVGIAVSTILGLFLADQRRIADLRRIQSVRTAERFDDFLRRLDATPPDERRRLASVGTVFLHQTTGPVPGEPDGEVAALLRSRLPGGLGIWVTSVPVTLCGPPRERRRGGDDSEQLWRATVEATDCWSITARLSDGTRWSFLTGPPPLLLKARTFDPAFLFVLAVTAAALALMVARMAARPIRALSAAAAKLGPELDAPQLPERGPADVRAATRAFNAMQHRLGQHLHEQTHMIAAITHDLQTPMTRLRLRLDQVEDEELRDRLLSDWQAMRGIVDEGLELARSTGNREEPVRLDVDSMIASIVEDEVDMGHVATFDRRAGKDVRCRPQMVRRCVQNLVDNAIKHGGSAHLSTWIDPRGLVIEVRDHGIGIPEDRLEAVFEPMVRLEESRSRDTGGTGLGLTIARVLARRNGADIHLENHPDGGLVATVTFPRQADFSARASDRRWSRSAAS
ncbi:HAMP domain-containing protein [Sphingomonas sp. PL-96]|uniref:ATP-binding protein n=1 Tax=Sphingomonas sp. PL-96 TaxID=2887201 RepID=UPI001E640F2A|nr:ATP-binding protein [Sphingomonas sp. PL-96]MCC2976579.1 HAMP domain-containing protein [Sphingomonas sp. PL-96]